MRRVQVNIGEFPGQEKKIRETRACAWGGRGSSGEDCVRERGVGRTQGDARLVRADPLSEEGRRDRKERKDGVEGTKTIA